MPLQVRDVVSQANTAFHFGAEIEHFDLEHLNGMDVNSKTRRATQ